MNDRKLRYMWAYSAGRDAVVDQHDRQLEHRRQLGYDVTNFCVTPTQLSREWLPFYQLDYLWKSRNRALLEMYDALAAALEDRDVLVLYNGANLHPEFVRQLHVLKVYTCADDPDSSAILSKPVARAFDMHLVNNAACLDMYRGWGLHDVHFWPLGSQVTEEEVADISDESVGDIALRPLSVVFFGGLDYWRRSRMLKLAKVFPDAYCAGRRWPRGYVTVAQRLDAYRQAQIGWNMHLSDGPINFRLYDLPAFGIMQICDNKSHLGQVFDLGKEVAGFDTTAECIELTRYYLAHPREQREMAVAARTRWRNQYTPIRVWQRLTELVEQTFKTMAPAPAGLVPEVRSELQRQLSAGSHDSVGLRLRRNASKVLHRGGRCARALLWQVRRRHR